MEDLDYKPDEVNEKVAKAYSKKYGFDLDEAKKRLAKNYRKEYESVDGREMVLRNTKYLRQIGPKVNGIEMREQQVHYRLNSVESKIKSLENISDELDKLQKEFTDLKLKMANAVSAISQKVEEITIKESNINSMYNKLINRKNNRSLKFILREYVNKLLCLLKIK